MFYLQWSIVFSEGLAPDIQCVQGEVKGENVIRLLRGW